MKKIITMLLFMFAAFTVSMAQTTTSKAPASVTKQDKATIAAQKKADKQAKALAKKQAKEVNSMPRVNNPATAHLNKNGTPDKRFKTDKKAAATAPAQTTSRTMATSVSKQDKAALAAQKKADKQAKVANTASPASNASLAHLNKNGTPDKRFKANNPATATPQAQARTQTPATVQPQASVTPARMKRESPQVIQPNNVKTADKVIGTDAQGRTIYQGPRGGKYYINKEGHKEYVK